jgi:hypothetical protein
MNSGVPQTDESLLSDSLAVSRRSIFRAGDGDRSTDLAARVQVEAQI